MFVGYDIETAGSEENFALQPWRVREGTAWITLSSAYLQGQHRVDKDHAALLDSLRDINHPVVTWNGIFDVAFLFASGYDISGIAWVDAVNLWKFLTNGQRMPLSWNLKAGVKKFLKDWTRQQEFLDMKSEELPDPSDPYWLNRVSMDAEATALIADIIWPQLTPKQQNLAKIQAVSLPAMAMSWVRGIRVDLDGVRAAEPVIIEKMIAQEKKLGLCISTPDNYIPSPVLRSPDKLRNLLYEDYGLQCTRWTDGGKSGIQKKSTDKAALTYLADQDDRVQEIMKWRNWNTILSKFINTPLEACEYLGSNVTHAAPRVFATYTKRGSFSSKVKKKKVGMALHQLPRGKEVRQYILPHEDDEFIVEWDVDGQEARWMAVFAQDQNMQNIFNSDTPDIHSYMGSQIAGISLEEFMEKKKAHASEIVGAHGFRALGKFANLSFNYRISVAAARSKARVDYDIDAHIDQVSNWKDIFKAAYPGIVQYWREAPKRARMCGYAETIGGNRYKLEMWENMNWGTSSSAINFPIQGSSSDQKELAMAVLFTDQPDLASRLLLEMHDALHMSLPGSWTMGYLKYITRLLDNIDYKKYWGVDLPVPFTWEGSVGSNEGNKIEFDYSVDDKLTVAEFFNINNV